MPARGTALYTGAWVLDRWQLRRELHGGRSGALWLVRERETRELAVARIALTAPQVERARREGAALACVQHDGLPKLIEQGALPDDGWCVVMEHVEGAPLAKVLKVARLPPPRAVGWARQIASAAAHLHERGVVHGDLHADNVVVARDEVGRERLVVVGLGAARVGDDAPEVPLASPQIVAPERVLGRPSAPPVDVYAIGVLAYRMITDRWPFGGSDAAAIHDAHLNRAAPAFGAEVPDLRLPPGLEGIVFRCLEKDPARRWTGADELVEEFARVEYTPHRDWVRADGAARSPHPAVAREVRPEPPVVDARGTWAIAALMVAVVVSGLWWLWIR